MSKSCNSSNYFKDSTPIKHTDSEISWNGADIHCSNEDETISIDICRGDRLTEANAEFATALCQLISLTDGAKIIIPNCFITAFGTQDKTLLNIITFSLNQLCATIISLESLETTVNTIDPLVTIDLTCCTDNPCVKTGQLKLSDALESIIDCICGLKTRVGALEAYTQIDNNSGVNLLLTEVLSIRSQLTTAQATITTLVKKTCCLPECTPSCG